MAMIHFYLVGVFLILNSEGVLSALCGIHSEEPHPVLQCFVPWHLWSWFSLFNRFQALTWFGNAACTNTGSLKVNEGRVHRASMLSCSLAFKSIFSPFMSFDIYCLCLIVWIFMCISGCVYIYRHINPPLCRLGKRETGKMNRLSAIQHGVHWGQWFLSPLRKILSVFFYW